MNYLEKLRKYWQKNKLIPSYRDMCKIFGVKSKNASYKIIQKLIDTDFLEKKTNGKLVPTLKFTQLGLPLFPEIRAGFPSPAEEYEENRITLDDYLIDHPNDSMLIKVKGDSMIEKGIYEGDLVIVRKGTNTSPGDTVVASVDGDFTLKILRKNKNIFYLEAGNSKYPDIKATEELQIVGKVVGVVRKY